jgi:hypothetical protein
VPFPLLGHPCRQPLAFSPPSPPPTRQNQIALALAVGEEALGFEHRDLHWGNVLLRAAPSLTTTCRLRGLDISVQTQVGAARKPSHPAGGVAACVEALNLPRGLP